MTANVRDDAATVRDLLLHALARLEAAAARAETLEAALSRVRAKHQGFIDGGRSSDSSVFVGAVQACDEIAALADGQEPR